MNPRLVELISEVLDLPAGEIGPHLRREDTVAWDSLTHLRLMTILEDAFRVQLSMTEIANVHSPGDLEVLLQKRGVLNG